jgi:transposase
MPGKARGVLVLSEDERATLTRWTRRQKSSQALAMRARIVLACADGTPNTHVAELLGVSRDMVGTWRSRFLARRLEGLSDEPRPGAPRKITDEVVEAVIVKTLESTPAREDSHWSTRSMAAATGLSQTAVSRIWRAFALKPYRVDDWKLSTDPLFIEKVRDIVGLYLDPPVGAMVLAVDEKSQMQALDRTAAVLPMMPAAPQRQTHVIGQTQRQHRHQEFLWFLRTIDKATPSDVDLHLIVDNYGTHKTPQIHQWLVKHPRFHLHFTPTYSSWLNMVERWFAELTNRKLRRSTHRSVAALEADVKTWIEAWTADPKPFIWTKTADQILETIAAYCSRINDSGH